MFNRNRKASKHIQIHNQGSGALVELLEPRQLLAAGVGSTTLLKPALKSAPAVRATLVATPTDVKAVSTSATTATISWTNADPNATGFYILRASGSGAMVRLATITSASTTSYKDGNLTPGCNYRYQVQAYSGGSVSLASTVASLRMPLSAPSSLTAALKAGGTVQLDWSNTAPTATGYLIQRSADGVTYQTIATLSSTNKTTYTDTAPLTGILSYYVVKALAGSTCSPASSPATVTAPMVASTGLTSRLVGPTSVELTWRTNDPSATGVYIQRATENGTYQTIATIGNVLTYTDSTCASATAYRYRVQGFNAKLTALPSNTISTVTPLAQVSGLKAVLNVDNSVALSWDNNEPNATGYMIARQSSYGGWVTLATISGKDNTTYTDDTVSSGSSYTYRVQAVCSTKPGLVAVIALTSVTTPMLAPSGLTATLVGATVKLSWTANDASAIGYTILRSADNITFTPIGATYSNNTYTDTSVLNASSTYYYQVRAFSYATTSGVSNTASVVIPASNVSVTWRYSNTELVISLLGTADSVALSQSGTTLTLNVAGTPQTYTAPAAGVFIYARGGTDSISIDSTVTTRTTVETIDGAVTSVSNNANNANLWLDSSDTFSGIGLPHYVVNFAGGVSKAFGVSLANPSDAGATKAANTSLWGSGPVITDVNQGSAGDCYFLSGIAGFAAQDPATLWNSAVDMGDGTYTVRFVNSGVPSYIRVSHDFSIGGFTGGYNYVHPATASGPIWAMVLEKAFCYFRTGANTYASIDAGWLNEPANALGKSSTSLDYAKLTDAQLFTAVSTALANHKVVTAGTPTTAKELVGGHAYTILSVSTDANGKHLYRVRNPWGVNGGTAEDAQGYAILTFDQMKANFDQMAVTA